MLEIVQPGLQFPPSLVLGDHGIEELTDVPVEDVVVATAELREEADIPMGGKSWAVQPLADMFASHPVKRQEHANTFGPTHFPSPFPVPPVCI